MPNHLDRTTSVNSIFPIVADIQRRLQRTRHRLNKTDAVEHTFQFCTLLITSLVVLSLLELLFKFNTTARTIIFFVAMAAFAGCGIWLILRPVLRTAGILS